MLNHPLTSVTNAARWRQESLLAEAAQDQAIDEKRETLRWGVIAMAFLAAFFRGRGL